MEKKHGVRGLHAGGAIASGDLLMSIPWPATISLKKDDSGCETIRYLISEVKKGESSSFWPYLRTLPDSFELPVSWTSLERKLLLPTGPPHDNFKGELDWTRHLIWWEQSCSGDLSNEVETWAVLLSVTRRGHVYRDFDDENSEGTGAFIPIYDLTNHRNGHWTNLEFKGTPDCFEVYADRNIAEGEELYNSYGTSTWEIFRDYGFVEDYPQIWGVGGVEIGGNRVFEFMIDEKHNSMEVSSDGWLGDAEAARVFIDIAAHELRNSLRISNIKFDDSMALNPERAEIAARFRKSYEDALKLAISKAENAAENGGCGA
jgi:hypothetical protein